MPHPKALLSLAAGALALAACSSGTAATATLPADSAPIHFRLHVEDTGHLLRVRPGDEVTSRLPLTGYEDPGWVLTRLPDEGVLARGGIVRSFLSERGGGTTAYHVFDFVAVGPGETTVTLTRGFQQFSFRVQVSPDA